jgi:DNA-binding transcriptional ArsR family regulator
MPWYSSINQLNLIDRKKLMQDWPAVYNLETIEQVKALADELRQRVLEELVTRAMTVTQLGEVLGIAPGKVHYHVRELERVRLLKLVETREKGGILEKYYRTVAERLSIPPDLLQRTNPEDHIGAVQAMLSSINDAFTSALTRALQRGTDVELPHTALLREHVYLTDEQFANVMSAMQEALEQYGSKDPLEGARQYTTVVMAYDTVLSLEGRGLTGDGAAPVDPTTVNAPLAHHSEGWEFTDEMRKWVIGAMSLGRSELERAIDEGRQLDITVTGLMRFAPDVTPDLVERAVGRFAHRGVVRASDAVLEVLERKEAATRGR